MGDDDTRPPWKVGRVIEIYVSREGLEREISVRLLTGAVVGDGAPPVVVGPVTKCATYIVLITYRFQFKLPREANKLKKKVELKKATSKKKKDNYQIPLIKSPLSVIKRYFQYCYFTDPPITHIDHYSKPRLQPAPL